MGLRGAEVFPLGGIRTLCRTARGHLPQFTEFSFLCWLTRISCGARPRFANSTRGITESRRWAGPHCAYAEGGLSRLRGALPAQVTTRGGPGAPSFVRGLGIRRGRRPVRGSVPPGRRFAGSSWSPPRFRLLARRGGGPALSAVQPLDDLQHGDRGIAPVE